MGPPTVFGKLVSVEEKEKETETESGVKVDQRDEVKEEDEAEDPKVAESAEHHDNPQKEIDATIDGNRSEAMPDESTKATEKPPSNEDDGKENQIEDETE